ncbi:hypothetical protein N7447_003895 [Penicillium robsamsonii]|uniref:uncharacterized protein n=1 Tax=Penicillium robsamsonii TaxID=1792511 RepID=UPI0025494074|nr:uncharacterized protein N7447_003895 [Penicillium robsamsonii]KAJ5827132.1 hypothetical protein N7447_003895 [Penicillium robsamsonii]
MAWYSILPPELTHLESWVARIFFFLGLITIGPWAFLVLLDATIWIYRLILWEVPYIGGRARGRQRPRAPSLNERPGGQRRAFGLRGVETDAGDNEGDLIPMDKTYKSRVALRKSVLDQHHDIVVAINNDETPEEDSRIRPAISELYNFMLGTYLPTRYPSMFRLYAESSFFQNLVTGATWPTTLSPTTPTIQALEILSQTVDEDFLILLPEISPDSEEQPRYVLQAYATCFPAGFNTREKLGLRLADIHSPVPRYQERIGRSMDKFFARIEVGKFVKRLNWSITIGTDLFAAFGGTHAMSGKKEEAIELGKLNVDQTVLRCERQTLHRLPVSKALVFIVHTYVYPIRQIKDEGSGEDLANAVDGLKRGNVPEIHTYKRGDVWGEALKDFLRA